MYLLTRVRLLWKVLQKSQGTKIQNGYNFSHGETLPVCLNFKTHRRASIGITQNSLTENLGVSIQCFFSSLLMAVSYPFKKKRSCRTLCSLNIGFILNMEAQLILFPFHQDCFCKEPFPLPLIYFRFLLDILPSDDGVVGHSLLTPMDCLLQQILS